MNKYKPGYKFKDQENFEWVITERTSSYKMGKWQIKFTVECPDLMATEYLSINELQYKEV